MSKRRRGVPRAYEPYLDKEDKELLVYHMVYVVKAYPFVKRRFKHDIFGPQNKIFSSYKPFSSIPVPLPSNAPPPQESKQEEEEKEKEVSYNTKFIPHTQNKLEINDI